MTDRVVMTAANAVLNVYQFLTSRISGKEMAEMARYQRGQLEFEDVHADPLYLPTHMLVCAAVAYSEAALNGHYKEAFALRNVLHDLCDWVEAVARRSGKPIVVVNGSVLSVVAGGAA